VPGYVLLHGGADDVDLEVVLSGKFQSGLCQSGGEAHVAQFFWNFRVGEYQDITAQCVIEMGDFTVALDFEAAGGYFLWWSRLTVKDVPHDS
jgi:hypothetical protein